MLGPEGLRLRSTLLQTIRSFFLGRGYIEVDTPIRLPHLLPEAHIQPFSSDGWFLQTSPELCMKILLSGGVEKIFQLCHCFRREEIGRLHHPEFTMLEWYHSGREYQSLMDECEDLVAELAGWINVGQGEKKSALRCKGRVISLEKPWVRLSLAEAFQRYAEVSVEKALGQDRFEEVLVEAVEPKLGWERPVFLYDYPVQHASLARPKKENPLLAERFELYIGGVELANGFSELVDPGLQRERFAEEIRGVTSRGGGAPAMPERFLDALERLGDCAGIAFGVDRLFMLLLEKEKLTDILPLDARQV